MMNQTHLQGPFLLSMRKGWPEEQTHSAIGYRCPVSKALLLLQAENIGKK